MEKKVLWVRCLASLLISSDVCYSFRLVESSIYVEVFWEVLFCFSKYLLLFHTKAIGRQELVVEGYYPLKNVFDHQPLNGLI